MGGSDDLLARLVAAGLRTADTPSLDPGSVLAYFREAQRKHWFVLWVLWRGVW